MKKKYRCEVDCANCAAKIEDAMRRVDGVQSVKINFLMQKLTFEAEESRFEALLQEAIQAGKRVEVNFWRRHVSSMSNTIFFWTTTVRNAAFASALEFPPSTTPLSSRHLPT